MHWMRTPSAAILLGVGYFPALLEMGERLVSLALRIWGYICSGLPRPAHQLFLIDIEFLGRSEWGGENWGE